MLKPLGIILVTLTLCTACLNTAPTSAAPVTLRPLIEAMAQRLEIATVVAQSKWHSGKPVQDGERESQVIINAESQAAAFMLTKEDVRQFMTAQMEANKMVQYARLAHWHESGQAPQKPDLSLIQGIRARLDILQPLMMEKYAEFQPWRGHSACSHWIDAHIQRQSTDPVIATALQRATDGLCIAGPNG